MILRAVRGGVKSPPEPANRLLRRAPPPGALLHELVVAAMKKQGADYKQVKFVNVGSSGDVFKALVAGTIDAGAGPIDFRDTAGKYNLTVIPDGEFYKELPLYVNQAMYASDKAIAEILAVQGFDSTDAECRLCPANPQS